MKQMERVCMYLRKSRADLDAESRGEGETLAKHKKALLKIAKHQKLNIIKIREEIVSGESLAFRPEMLKVLQEVEQGHYDAVLCMDMDRLGRGNMREQGIILETFKNAKTKIITTRKTYDLEDEWDEEYTEFETFMARKELKIITRRLQGGRIRSVEEGNYIGTRPPYGYEIKKLAPKERILVPHPDQAPVVKMIFEWYTHEDPKQRIGASKIANKLNEMGYKTYTGINWSNSSVLTILKNAVYAGRLQWKKKEEKKSLQPGKQRDTRTRPKEEWIDVEGKHEPLVSPALYNKAQDVLKNRYHVPYNQQNGITNPLAGLITCHSCGASMVYRPYTKQKPHLMCYNRFCDSKSTRFEFVEQRLISGLRDWLHQYKAQEKELEPLEENNDSVIAFQQQALAALEKELVEIEKQKGRLHDFLERGIYDEETYLKRSQILAEKHIKTESSIKEIEEILKIEQTKELAESEFIPQVENVLSLYPNTDDPKKKNNLLKSILEKAVYRKEKTQSGEDFSLNLYPKLPDLHR
jgi:site-specific DNA recombinase